MELRPHHLLRIRGGEDLLAPIPDQDIAPQPAARIPDWVTASLSTAPWLVVRRALFETDRIPAGVRGRQRGQRFATWLSPDKILEVAPPHALVDASYWIPAYSQGLPPALQSLLSITPLLEATGYVWGPTGSCGFQLATGIPALSANSDLDLLLEIPKPISVKAASSLLGQLQQLSVVRLDVQLNTPSGGVALAEYCRADTVLVKTDTAPVLQKISELWK